MMTSQSYQYQPLEGKNWVRVLQLLPSTSRTAPLQCHVVHLDREKLPNYGLNPRTPYSDCRNFAELQAWMNTKENSYEAVSYVWGAPAFTKELVIERDFVIGITEVVDTMLRWFRDEKTTTSLWIDAICLDQANRREVAEQVALMHEIYNQVRKTRIWIGPKDDYIDSVWHFLMSFDPYVKYSGGKPARQYLEELVEWTFGEKSFRTLEKFFGRRWFKPPMGLTRGLLESKCCRSGR
jgi:hypothetical protein